MDEKPSNKGDCFTSIPPNKVEFFLNLPDITSAEHLILITGDKTQELNLMQQGNIQGIESSNSGNLILLDNISRAIEYAEKSEQVAQQHDSFFKATGTRSMLGFDSHEYIGQIAESNFIAAVNRNPFYYQAGLLIPKPQTRNGKYYETIGSWGNLSFNELQDLGSMSCNGISIWNALSAPSSPYMHFQYIPDKIETMKGELVLPLAEAIQNCNYDQHNIYIGNIKLPLQVLNTAEQTITQLNLFEQEGTPSDLIITNGRYIIVPKDKSKFVVKYPWDVAWRPTAERLGFIFYHPNMKNYLDDINKFIKAFWEVNNSQIRIDES